MKVNEELHIPDRINVGQFIDRLFERYIYDFYMHNPIDGLIESFSKIFNIK